MKIYIVWFFIVSTVFIIPISLSFIFKWKFNEIPEISINAYILWNFIHFLLQLIFSFLNYRNMNKIIYKPENGKKVGLQMVGWKEDPNYFEKALKSIKTILGYDKFIFISDGNDEDDYYLQDIFLKIFPNAYIHNSCNFLYKEEDIWGTIESNDVIFCFQKHLGKRHALNSGFSFLKHCNMDYIVTTDSDTIFEKNTIIELKKILDHYDNCHGVTGTVKIFNIENFQSLLISMKYWIAFFIERGAQSYHGVVSCIAGPLGMYKTSSISEIQKEWLEQTFLGQECTFGDDRHLTNLLLSRGYNIYYNHKAICWTETPVTLKRWILQQIRWGKSFIRELFLNLKWFHKQSLWLAYDLLFLSLYSIFLIIGLIVLLFQFKVANLIYFLYSIVIVSSLRGVFGVIYYKDIRYMYFMFYGLFFVFILLPIKLWCLFTLKEISWGTSTRKDKKDKTDLNMLPVILWNILLFTGIVLTMVFNSEKFNDTYIQILTIILGSLFLIMTINYWIFNKWILKLKIEE